MKKIIIKITSCILILTFTGCYSYEYVDKSYFESNKKDLVLVSIKSGNNEYIFNINEPFERAGKDGIIVFNSTDSLKIIPYSEIETFQIREFDFLNSSLLTLGIVVVVLGVYGIIQARNVSLGDETF